MSKSKPCWQQSKLSRREIIKKAGITSLLATMKPFELFALASPSSGQAINFKGFDQAQQQTLIAVQLQLFPDDGDGPSATDIQAFNYLQWALQDPVNAEDDQFIAKGIGWLNDLSNSTYRQLFIALNDQQQAELIHTITKSQAGERWLALLMYYLVEALLLDPIYGGNPKGIGWQWLALQPGYPRPTSDNTFNHFL